MSRRRTGLPDLLLELPIVESTMDEARAQLLDGRTDLLGVRAGHQTRGRGRRHAIWSDEPGHSLLVTYILPLDDETSRERVAFAAGIAVVEAVEALAGVACQLKWPNDAMVEGKKLSGTIVETVETARGVRALVGIGVNVNQTAVPPGLRGATSLRVATGRAFDVQVVERAVRDRLIGLHTRAWPVLVERWRAHDGTTGRTFVAEVPGGRVTGIAVGVDDEGALLLRLPDGATIPTRSASSSESG